MQYLLGSGDQQRIITLEKEDVVGSGGEAVIFGHGGKAIKIYRHPDTGRADKLGWYFNHQPNLPPTVIAPEQPVFNRREYQMAGFQMNLMPDTANPLAMLMRQDFCDQHAIGGKIKAQIFLNILKTLQRIHASGVVVGDLNDQNEAFDLSQAMDPEVYWLDVDSWQFGGHPCKVGTEAYLTPDLYDIDLTQRPFFKPEHDLYSFAVLLFRSLMMFHPFMSGFHRQFNTLFLRAKHGLTFLDKGVRTPKKANPPEIITDDLMDQLLKTLKRKPDANLTPDLLAEYEDTLVECPSCHIWYPAKRDLCPGCAAKTFLDAAMMAKVVGCLCDTILETTGKILYLQAIGDTVYCIANEGGTVVLHTRHLNGSTIRKELFGVTPGARYVLLGSDILVVCMNPRAENPKLFLVDISGSKPKPITQTSTGKFAGGGAVFGCTHRRLYRIAGSIIMSADLFGKNLVNQEVCQAIPGQTWFTVDTRSESKREILLGCHRLLDELDWFLVVGTSDGRNYTRRDLSLKRLQRHESLVDVSVKFSDNSALVLRHTKLYGKDHVIVEIVDIDSGQVIYSSYFEKSRHDSYSGHIHGRGYAEDRILHATDDGIVSQDVASGSENILSGTGNYVSHGDRLQSFRHGVLVLTGSKVLHLTPEK